MGAIIVGYVVVVYAVVVSVIVIIIINESFASASVQQFSLLTLIVSESLH